jgi:hypothetical protein
VAAAAGRPGYEVLQYQYSYLRAACSPLLKGSDVSQDKLDTAEFGAEVPMIPLVGSPWRRNWTRAWTRWTWS